jgi:4-amino-4-deoxy-L-arabinose transferase-like glycosyltransferase
MNVRAESRVDRERTAAGYLEAMTWLLLVLALVTALLLRAYRLGQLPVGVDYDEAGNYVLASEIADGTSRPVFIRAYAGREALFYWLAAASMRLLGKTLLTFRLAAALCGLATVALTYLLGREMFRDAPALEWRWVPLLGTVLIATSYWHVHVSRYGYRANAMPPLVAASMLLLWRGLRRGNWATLAAGGLLCGLSANTYLAIRAYPLVLLPVGTWAVLALPPQSADPPEGPSGGWRRRRLLQIGVFGTAALIALAPLGLFFLRHPTYFGIRMGQASVLDPEIHGGDLWGTLGRVTLKALGIFTVRGDADPIYNTPGKPIYGGGLGAAFYVGLATCAYGAARRHGAWQRMPYLVLLLWLPVMLMPNVLGARGVPHALRSIGLIPAVYFVPALGLTAILRTARRGYARLAGHPMSQAATDAVAGGLALLLLGVGGCGTWQAYQAWTRSPGAYYGGSASLRRAAEYLGAQDVEEASLWVSNNTYRHTTYAAMCENYAELSWVSEGTLVYPLGKDRPALYVFDFTNPLDPVLGRYVPAETLQHRDLGPDGGIGFEAYLVPREQMDGIAPQVAASGNLGGKVVFLGYDLNQAPRSGEVLDVTLYWQALEDGDRDDYAFFAHLVDDLGFRWGEETFFAYPSSQWRAGDLILYHREIPIAPGTPPGAYRLQLGVSSASLDARLPLLNAGGQMVGTAIEVGPIQIDAAVAVPEAYPPIERAMQIAFGKDLTLLGADRDRGDLRPGETLALSLYWLAGAEIEEDYLVALWLEGDEGRVDLWRGPPVHGQHPFPAWQAPGFLRDRYALRLPTDAPAGDYQLQMALLDTDGRPQPTDAGEAVTLYTIHVHATDRLWAPPEVAHPVGAELGDVVELVGYDLLPTRISPGGTLHLTLVWRCLGEMDASYTVFTHLLDTAQQIRGQQDNPPVGGSYPTTLWVPGEIVVDTYSIEVHDDAPPGRYAVEVGMYDPANLERLPVIEPSGVVGNRILLGEVQIRE